MVEELTIEELDPIEKEAVMYISNAVDCPIKIYQRSNSYLTICNESGNDFCRVKASSRTLWISLDMNNTGFEDDERLAFVPNKNQRHWKITLSDLEKINEYSDIIKACSKITY